MFTEQKKENEEISKEQVREFMSNVVSNPITGRIVMMGSALRFQSACMDLINDYEKRGIESVPVKLLVEFIMHSTNEAIKSDILDNTENILKLFEQIKEMEKKDENK